MIMDFILGLLVGYLLTNVSYFFFKHKVEITNNINLLRADLVSLHAKVDTLINAGKQIL